MTNLYRIRIPRIFADDHAGRDLPTGQLVKRLPSGAHLYDCTVQQLREWRSDAQHYSDCAGPGWDIDGTYALGLQNSARATAKRADDTLRRIADGIQLPIPAKPKA